MQEDNYIQDAKKAEEIFNKTSVDFLHAIENCDWNETEMKNKLYREKALLELRRPTKKMIAYYNFIEPIIEYLKNDETFRNILNTTRMELPKFIEKVESGDYMPK